MENAAPTFSQQIQAILTKNGFGPLRSAPDAQVVAAIQELALPAPATHTAAPKVQTLNPTPTKSTMTNPLLGCDPKEVSPARAGAAFAEFAKKLCTEQSIDYTQAWSRAKELHPDLHARMCERTPAVVSALPNSVPDPNRIMQPGSTTSAVLKTSKFVITPAFHLPPNVPDDILAAAFEANKSQFVTVDSKAIFLGLCTYLMKKQGISISTARRQLCDDYPALSRAAGQMPGM